VSTKKKPARPATKPAPAQSYAVQQLALEKVDESPTNPRKTFRDIDELAEDLKVRGMLQPVLCRPRGKRFELVFGARRYRAAVKAKLKTIPSMVREIEDAAVIEIQLVENSKRDDIHPLEEADGFRALHKDHGYAAEEIAAKIGKSKSHVFQRLKLCELGAAGRNAFLAGKLTAATALLVARIPDAKLQAEACKEITAQGYDGQPMSFRRAVDMVQREFMCKLDGAGFLTSDASLLPKAGPCSTCPKRTGVQAELFDDVKSGNTCTDPACFKAKLEAHWAKVKASAKEDGVKILSESEAKKVFKYDRDDPDYSSGFVARDQSSHDYTTAKTRTYGQIVKDQIQPVLARGASGRIVELYPRAEVDRLLKKVETPAQKEDRDERKAELKAQREAAADRLRAFEALLVTAEGGRTDAGFLRFVIDRVLSSMSWQLQREIAKRRDVKAKSYEEVHAVMRGFRNGLVPASEGVLRAILVELLCIHMLNPSYGVGVLVEACKRFDVEPPKHDEADLDDDLDEDLDGGEDENPDHVHGGCLKCHHMVEDCTCGEAGNEDDAGDVPSCRVCGCTENSPCPGGCSWAEDPEQLGDICSQCVGKVAVAADQVRYNEDGNKIVVVGPMKRPGEWQVEVHFDDATVPISMQIYSTRRLLDCRIDEYKSPEIPGVKSRSGKTPRSKKREASDAP
jgi:ParB/RepB/Spo0J family partition protein